MSNGRNSSSSFRGLPPLPPLSTAATGAPTGEFGQRPESSSGSTKRTSVLGNLGNSLANSANRLSMQSKRASNVPRPAPIPIPEPVPVAISTSVQPPLPAVSNESSGEGPSSSSSSTGSALASVSAELVQHASIPAGMHSHSSSVSPSSPRETNGLLSDGSMTPTGSSQPRVFTTSPPTGARPHSAVDSSSSRPPPSSYDSGNRPHSSADAWSMPESSSAHASPALRSNSPSVDSLLRPGQLPRTRSTNNFPSNTPSPLNPNVLPLVGARQPRPGSASSRPGSMVLYRLAGVGDDFNPQMSSLSPPVTTNSRRASRFSTLSSSSYSVFSDSKYPMPAREDGSLTPPPSGAFLAYEYDPSADQDAPDDADDALHRPDEPGKKDRMAGLNTRGVFNVLCMVLIPLTLITLFVLYPVISHFDHNAQSALFTGNDHGNTPDNNGGTSSTVRTADQLVDPDTPDAAKKWTNPVDGSTYNLVFSDEFKTEGRTFADGDDPFWQAMDLYDTKNNNLNYYATDHVTTKGGHLIITMEEKTANGYDYQSGMLQSWNKFCFTGGYVEISVSLPGTSTNVGFTPQAYTMGNLARSGYAASEYGLYPYSYDTCDGNVGAGAVLPGQRLSACTCQASYTNGDHPGPQGAATVVRGRGAPQIDLLNYADQGQDQGVISQGIRYAPFSTNRDRTTGTTIESATDSQVNPYTGGDAEELLGVLTNVPHSSYESGGGQFTAFGYVLNPNNDDPTSAALHWIKGGNTELYRITGDALAASNNGDVGQRLISQEPMYLTLALALSRAIVEPVPTTLTFPAKFVVDYVRVYQPDGQDPKVTCDPTDMPTSKYITKHRKAYDDATLTTWGDAGYNDPTNSNNGDC